MDGMKRRLDKLNRVLRAQSDVHGPEDPAVTYARNYVARHHVDKSLFDRWHDGEFVEVDLNSYTVLTEAVAATWDKRGVYLALDGLQLFSVEAVELSAEHMLLCEECKDPFGPTCKLAGQWPGRPTNTYRRFDRWYWNEHLPTLLEAPARNPMG